METANGDCQWRLFGELTADELNDFTAAIGQHKESIQKYC